MSSVLILLPRYIILLKNAGPCPSFSFLKVFSRQKHFSSLYCCRLLLIKCITSSMIKLEDWVSALSLLKGYKQK